MLLKKLNYFLVNNIWILRRVNITVYYILPLFSNKNNIYRWECIFYTVLKDENQNLVVPVSLVKIELIIVYRYHKLHNDSIEILLL